MYVCQEFIIYIYIYIYDYLLPIVEIEVENFDFADFIVSLMKRTKHIIKTQFLI